MKDEKKSKAQLIHELEEARRLISELKDAVSRGEDSLKESEQIFRQIFENAADGILLADVEDAKIFMGNGRICTELGYSPDEIKNLQVVDIHPEKDLQFVLGQFDQLKQKTITVAQDIPVKRRDGSTYYADVSSFPMTLKDKTYLIGIFRDITERKQAEQQAKKLEAQHREAWKMESIRTFAGGIAHDFNNILSAIIGYAELAMIDLSDPLEIQNHLRGVIDAGNRARGLVSQIIMFSRHCEPKFVPTMLNRTIDDSFKYLRAIIPLFIEIRRKHLDPGLVMADPVQLRQVIVNLCSNAVQAMGKTAGVLTVGLEKVEVYEELASRYPDLTPGPHLRLTISDTGHGMPPEVEERIFDPYFTTRKLGEGSGLGLAVVQGIVKKHKGTITCTSTPGVGTTFAIYLPEVEAAEKGMEPPETVQPVVEIPHPKGNERILFIDDDPTLVFLASELLGNLGYHVVTQTSSVEALELFRKDPYRFDLVITDMTMPSMMGDRLAQTFLEIRRDIPIILCTGYSEYISEEQSKSIGIREFIMKPYGTKDMAKTIRRVLDEG